MTLRAALASFLIGIWFFSTQVAHARPAKANAQQMAEAKAAFAKATAAYDAGNFEEALRGFERSHELSQRPALFFNMAACAEKLGKLREAAIYLRTYLGETPQAEDGDKVRERIGGLEARAQQADEQRAAEQKRLEEEARRQREAPPPTQTVAVEQPAPVEHVSIGRAYAGGFAGLGATALLGVVAAGLGGSAIAKYNHLNSECGMAGCGSRVDPVRTQAIVADTFLGLTGAAAVTTIILFAIEAKHRRGGR